MQLYSPRVLLLLRFTHLHSSASPREFITRVNRKLRASFRTKYIFLHGSMTERVYPVRRVDVNFPVQDTRNYGMKIRILSVSDWRQLQRTLSLKFTTLRRARQREREREREREPGSAQDRPKRLLVHFHFFHSYLLHKLPTTRSPFRPYFSGFSKCSKRKIAAGIALNLRSDRHLSQGCSVPELKRRHKRNSLDNFLRNLIQRQIKPLQVESRIAKQTKSSYSIFGENQFLFLSIINIADFSYCLYIYF